MESLQRRILGRRLVRVRLASPFLLRTVEPPLATVEGRLVDRVDRLGKRIVIGLEGDLYLLLHLMISGRLQWKRPSVSIGQRGSLAGFDFEDASLLLTETGAKKRASLHVVAGSEALAGHNPGGLEILTSTLEAFDQALRRRNHTLKRALTDPHLISGVGNAYSDEILHSAGLSPFLQTRNLSQSQMRRLHASAREVLTAWIDRRRREVGEGFPRPATVTAFREGFAVHGRYALPCPSCGTVVQRIRYAENETNYCPTCQTGGRIMADLSIFRLLKDDWPPLSK